MFAFDSPSSAMIHAVASGLGHIGQRVLETRVRVYRFRLRSLRLSAFIRFWISGL